MKAQTRAAVRRAAERMAPALYRVTLPPTDPLPWADVPAWLKRRYIRMAFEILSTTHPWDRLPVHPVAYPGCVDFGCTIHPYVL